MCKINNLFNQSLTERAEKQFEDSIAILEQERQN